MTVKEFIEKLSSLDLSAQDLHSTYEWRSLWLMLERP